MKPLPLPVRVAAGLAVTAVDRARHLPERLAGLPVTMVSQALQLSMRLQQQMTELAIKGDDALSTLRPGQESPEWATFDEDGAEDRYDASTVKRSRFDAADVDADAATNGEPVAAGDPWAAEERAMLHELDNAAPAEDEPDDDAGPAALADYAELTLPQVRARMRRLSIDELAELVEFERAHDDRPAFVGMLTRRIGTLRDQQ
ncbi:MAG TPA: lipid droplet-associated protein [Pseudonocardiaceae bacterium]|nr:lipid droplet-associated protein [Pseudonocardiaceae bacterium]